MKNKAKQLENKRKRTYDKLYFRQPQLLKRLIPFFRKADIIRDSTEPYLHSTNNPLGRKDDKKMNVKKYSKKKMVNKLNEFSNKNKPLSLNGYKKVSEIRPEILYALK